MRTKANAGIIALVATCFAAQLFATSPAVTWYVDAKASPGGSGLNPASAFMSVQEAADTASSGDTVRIAAGVYRENVVVDGKSLTIVGAGRDATVIDANGSGRPLAVTGADADGTCIKSLQLLNGVAGQGGGLYVNGPTSVVLEDASIVCCSNTSDGEGAAAYGPAWVVRTLVERCDTPTSSSSVQRGVLSGVLGAVNSVFVNNGHKVASGSFYAGCSILAVGTYGPFVNCNFIHNFGTIHPDTASLSSHGSYVFRNCLSLGVETRAFRQSLDCQYCAQSTSGSMPNGKHNFGGDTKDGEEFLTERAPVVSTLDDWRLTPGSQLIDQGLSAALTQTYDISGRGSVTIPEEFAATDYYGASRIQGGTVDIGAAEGPVANMSGIVFLDYSDKNLATNMYVNCRRSTYPSLDPKDAAAANGVWFGASGTVPKGVSLVYGGDSNIIYACHNNQKYPDAPTVLVLYYPDIKGRMTFAIPSSGAFTNTIIKATAVKYVDPAADASLADGTAGHPYRTLQAASDAASAASAQYTIIRAKEGVYAEGGSQGIADSDNVCTTSNRVYISGKNVHLVGAGPGKSIIMGKKVAGDSRLKGCGPGAMRCVQVSNDGKACITGFTLTGGATDSDPVYQQKPGKTGDVKIRGNFGGGGLSGRTWCNGSRYAAMVQDCIISSNAAYFGAGVYTAICRNSILMENETVQQDVRSNVVITAAGGSAALDSICSGCVVYGNRNCKSLDGAVMPYTSSIYCFDTTFGPVSTGYKIYDTSRSFTYNCLDVGSGLMAGTQTGNVSVNESTVEPATLRPYSGSPAFGGGSSGYNDYYYGYYALSMDGVGFSPENPTAGAWRTPSPKRRSLYVSPSGDDANDGLTSATAKKTLAAVMAIASCSDVVHAAPGVYDQGEITNTVKLISGDVDAMGSRVVIPEGVSLVADEGPEVTFIKGSYGNDSNGYGAGAVRGVYMYEESVLEGFTITDCATYASSYERENSCGACVVAPKANVARPAVVRNCRLTGGRARSGAAAYGGVLERCRIDNCIVVSGGLVFYSKMDNCLVVSTKDSGNVSALLNYYGIGNSTIYVRRAAGDADFLQGDSSATIENSIIYYDECSRPTTLKKAKNCIVKSVSGLTIDSSCTGIIPAGTLSSLLDTTTYRPVAGSAAIDAGDMALFSAHPSVLDCGGGQRVYSGHVDIGAYEYAPFAEMSTALARHNVTVCAVDGDATLNGGVLLETGILEAVWQKKSEKARREVDFEVTGGGVLVVSDDTGIIGRYAANGVEKLMWSPSGTGTKTVRFTYQPAADDMSGTGAFISKIEAANLFVVSFR